MSLKSSLLAATAALAIVSGANAEVVAFEFKGSVVYGSPMGIPVGTPMSGRLTYDTDTDAWYSQKGYASYQIVRPKSVVATVAGYSIESGEVSGVDVWNRTGGNVEDMLQVSASPVTVGGTLLPQGAFVITLGSRPGNHRALQTTKLPRRLKFSNFDFTEFNYIVLQAEGTQEGQLLHFSIDSLEELEPAR